MELKKVYIISVLFILSIVGWMNSVFAGHIAGGEIIYKDLGAGSGAGTRSYEITLRLFRECNPPPGGQPISPLPGSVIIGIFNKSNNNNLLTSQTVPLTSNFDLALTAPNPCIVNAPNVCYQVGLYTFRTELTINPNGYVVSFQTCCRTNGILNLNAGTEGATYATEIPGTLLINNGINNSAVFNLKDTTLICKSTGFSLDFGATDADGDSLSYAFCDAYNGGGTANATPVIPSTPPYGSVSYAPFFGGTNPLGNTVTIDAKTGIISGTAPIAGRYVVTVCVSEWRGGKIISVTRKDFTLRIGDCELSAASLKPSYISCDGYNWKFQNESPSPGITSYAWDFGVPSDPAAKSTQPTPNYTYKDTGNYTIKLKVSNAAGCADSASAVLKIFPGFQPKFSITGSCVLNPYQFNNTTYAAFGVVDSVFWDFGVPSLTTDTSTKFNPSYKYNAVGNYTVRLFARSSKGCSKDTLQTIVVKDKPIINLPFRDTLICSIDSLPIPINSSGNITWTPNYNILNRQSANPIVFPKDTTVYFVTVNENGCINSDSVKVNVLDFITVELGNDTTICLSDAIRLQPKSDALSYRWSPDLYLSQNDIKNPTTTPLQNITYYVTANLGYCQDRDSIKINVVPYPQARVGNDTVICANQRIQLSGSIVGSSFKWIPNNGMLNASTLHPIVAPVKTTAYILQAFDTIGCPKPFNDTIVVTVNPLIIANAGKDTSIVETQPLQLLATGGKRYQWQPSSYLNDPTIANPIAAIPRGVEKMKYTVTVFDDANCSASDEVEISIYKTKPEIFVPSGFSPNKDGRNDLLRPILVGMRNLDFFNVYNRWGQLLFTTKELGKGWDGNFKGVPQASGTYVYTAQAIDYLGNLVQRKGTVVLIR